MEIYRDYKSLCELEELCFKPQMLESFNIKEISDYRWIFGIIPNFLTAYLLGFPVISMDIPSDKNINDFIKLLEEKGEEEYFSYISKKYNKPYLVASEFNIPVGNNLEEEYTDLCYNKIVHYNRDDIVSLFNNGVVHHFSCKEFETILKKRENPYNRQNYPNLDSIIENLKFKKKVQKNLILRGLEMKLDGTMLENFMELKKNILVTSVNREQYNYRERDFYPSLLNLILGDVSVY